MNNNDTMLVISCRRRTKSYQAASCVDLSPEANRRADKGNRRTAAGECPKALHGVAQSALVLHGPPNAQSSPPRPSPLPPPLLRRRRRRRWRRILLNNGIRRCASMGKRFKGCCGWMETRRERRKRGGPLRPHRRIWLRPS